jgi:hypothetical protein
MVSLMVSMRSNLQESEPEESEGGLGADGIGDGDACR